MIGDHDLSIGSPVDHAHRQEAERRISRPRATDIDRTLGQHIRRRRIALGLTQKDLAARVNVTYQQLHKYEQGVNRMAIGRMVMIADALGTTVGILLRGQGRPETSDDDREVLELVTSYRMLPQRQRDGIRALVRTLL